MNENLTHDIHVWGERSDCGTPGHSDAHMKCSCGWSYMVKHTRTSSEVVQKHVLSHRISSIEKALGIRFSMTYGEEYA